MTCCLRSWRRDCRAHHLQARRHEAGRKGLDGFYATHTAQHPYLDEASQPIRFWATKYKTRFNKDPTVFSVHGYNVVDVFIRAAQKAGPKLTVESFMKAMDGMSIPPDIFGSPQQTFRATKRLGSDMAQPSQLQEGRWKVISDDMKP